MTFLDLLAGHPGILFSGFGLGLSLIIVIGAQNAYVLRQGARREHLLAVVLICIASDVTLILAGVAGFATVIDHAPWVITAMRWFGVVFLVGYAVLAAKRALRPSGATLMVEQSSAEHRGAATVGSPHNADAPSESASGSTATIVTPKTDARRLVPVVLTALALTWLNPHVYLDTVVLLGSVANTHGPDARWAFAIGACLASVSWFIVLGFGARLLSRWLASPLAWRILDGIIAAIMLALAASLAFTPS